MDAYYYPPADSSDLQQSAGADVALPAQQAGGTASADPRLVIRGGKVPNGK